MATKINTYSTAVNTAPHYGYQLKRFAVSAMVTMAATLILIVYLLPFGNMALTSIKSQAQLSSTSDQNVLPLEPESFTYQGQPYPVYTVPFEDGTTKNLALIKKGRETSDFVDPSNPDVGVITWPGRWRTLQAVSHFAPRWENYSDAYTKINLPLLYFNTLFIAIAGVIGTLLSCISVAYAFARFPIPGKNFLFIILIGTIILPTQVTLVPTFAFFAAIHWTGTWLPLIVPHFFANAYNVFLLRQFFMTLPRELDEAAMIDGAGPFRILWRIIIPQSYPAIVAVSLFHFIFSWNDYFNPLLYLLGKPELQPISVGVQVFNYRYGPQPELVQATSLMAMALPLIIFFLAQKVFMRGVVITGVDK